MLLPQRFSLLVLGQGSTGLEVARWGVRHLGDRVTSIAVVGGSSSAPTDATRALEERGVSFAYGTEDVEGSFDVCVASPGISEFSAFFAAGRSASSQIMGEPEFAWRLSPERWVGITGTNGKTTTTALAAHLLSAAGMEAEAVGNIGTAPVSAVDARPAGSWLVAELSSYQLATTEHLHPRVGVLLNITPDHLAWHRTHENYVAAKERLFANMDEGDLAVVCVGAGAGDAPHALESLRARGVRVCELALEDTGAPWAAFLAGGTLTVRRDGAEVPLLSADELHIPGEHNVLNALAASAAALEAGADVQSVRAGLSSFHPLEHRIEPVATVDGVRYVNDSKATNTDAVEKALTAFADDDVVLLLGGSDKGTDLGSFSKHVAERVRAVVCFGAARERFSAAMHKAGKTADLEVADAENLVDALDVARSIARQGSVVLLSPACASFDEFSGFEERGRRFKELVAGLEARSRQG